MLQKTGTDRWGPDIDTSRVKNGITHSFDLHFFDYLDKCHFTFCLCLCICSFNLSKAVPTFYWHISETTDVSGWNK